MKLPKAEAYPKELHINEETYTVHVVKRIPGEPASTLGLCDFGTKQIHIKKASKAQMFRTLIHETLHAMECEYSMDLKHETVYKLERAIGDLLLMNF